MNETAGWTVTKQSELFRLPIKNRPVPLASHRPAVLFSSRCVQATF